MLGLSSDIFPMCLHISCGILYFYHLHFINPAKDPRDPKNVTYNI